MPALLRTASQDHGYRRWAMYFMFLALQCTQLGMTEHSFIFLAAAAHNFSTTTLPSRRCKGLPARGCSKRSARAQALTCVFARGMDSFAQLEERHQPRCHLEL